MGPKHILDCQYATGFVLNFAKKDASKQGHTLQTKYTFTENALGFYHAVDWNNDKWICLGINRNKKRYTD